MVCNCTLAGTPACEYCNNNILRKESDITIRGAPFVPDPDTIYHWPEIPKDARNGDVFRVIDGELFKVEEGKGPIVVDGKVVQMPATTMTQSEVDQFTDRFWKSEC